MLSRKGIFQGGDPEEIVFFPLLCSSLRNCEVRPLLCSDPPKAKPIVDCDDITSKSPCTEEQPESGGKNMSISILAYSVVTIVDDVVSVGVKITGYNIGMCEFSLDTNVS